MQFKSVKRLGLVALSTAILVVFVYAALGAQDDNNSGTAAGVTSVMKIKDQSSGEQQQQASEPPSSKEIESEKSTPESKAKSAEIQPLAQDQITATAEDGDLKPVANPDEASPITLEAASFKGVTPGATSIEEVEKLWGPPKKYSNKTT